MTHLYTRTRLYILELNPLDASILPINIDTPTYQSSTQETFLQNFLENFE